MTKLVQNLCYPSHEFESVLFMLFSYTISQSDTHEMLLHRTETIWLSLNSIGTDYRPASITKPEMLIQEDTSSWCFNITTNCCWSTPCFSYRLFVFYLLASRQKHTCQSISIVIYQYNFGHT